MSLISCSSSKVGTVLPVEPGQLFLALQVFGKFVPSSDKSNT